MVYERIKRVAFKIIPKNILVGQEQRLRKLVAVFYKGSKYQCTVCEKRLRKFIHLKTGAVICPYCGSGARHRRLWTLLEPRLRDGLRVLDFSPPRCLYTKMMKLGHIEYTPTDLLGEFVASKSLDITKLEVDDASYDLIICYHVLEHVVEDKKAMSELYRVLSPGGSCTIQTPFKDGDTYEDATITDAAGRLKHFDQEDHVRIYSVSGLTDRLSAAGFKVERLFFNEKEGNYHGFRDGETVLVASKAG
jgi:SAM-dependent methyltransferase